MATPIDKPKDLRPLIAKYAGRCHSCRIPISIGDATFYSPGLRKIGCPDCWGTFKPAPAKEQKKRTSAEDQKQIEWRRLCTYLRTCLLAEAGESVLDFQSESFPTLAGVEQLLSSSAPSVVLKGAVVEGRLSRVRNTGPRDFLYGWPTVVVDDANGRTKVAPLFVVTGEAEKDSANGVWTFTPTTDPDLNIALLSGRIFEPAIAAEVDAVIENSIDFGDRKKLNQQIEAIARTLGLDCIGINQMTLSDSYSSESGIYNCALLLDANDNGASRDLLRELELLATKTDWKETAAAMLLPGTKGFNSLPSKNKAGPVCGPLFLNRTQEDATNTSRRERITVVTGPPGTGKSQLVVSAVANAWVDQETVLVTSTNNGAVDVAVSRANNIATGLLVRTGNKNAREALPASVSDIVGQYKNTQDDFELKEGNFRSRLARSQIARQTLHKSLIDVERLDTQLTQIVHQIDHLSNQLWSSPRRLDEIESMKEVALKIRRVSKTLFFRGLRLRRLHKKLGTLFSDSHVQLAKSWAEFVISYAALRTQVEDLRRQSLCDPDRLLRETDGEWVTSSEALIRLIIQKSIQKHPGAYAQIGNAGGAGGKLAAATALAKRALRGWACTTLSMSRNFNLEAGYFDLAIIDEASQCNVAHILPIAYRAKRLLVVGDPNQLPPIVQVGRKTVDSIAEIAGMRSILGENSGLDFLDGSAYFGFEKSIGIEKVILLNEHYRCHPKIARWFNQAFYGSTLTVMTDISEMKNDLRGISWIDVEGEASRPSNQRSWINSAEISEVVKIFRMCMDNDLSVGVVSPFSAQASAIARAVESTFSAELLSEVDFTAGTAHRFQGDERDIIIFSSCVAPGMKEHAIKWVEKERNLINVAVSRARQRLIVIGNPSIANLNCPTISSLRAFILEVNDDGGNVDHRVDSESESKLLNAMITGGLSPLAKVDVEGFEIDFAIMHGGRKINLEVDGDQHFDASKQQCRQDLLRDRVLTRAGWEVLRFPAWRCFVEPEKVISEISMHLDSHH
jgi:very-short-patch-repair endonuclease